MTQRNVERMLTEQAAPRPPEGLAERIKAEIPDPLEASPVFRNDTDIVRLPRRQYWQLAAAAVIVVALTAAVTWQLRHVGPDPRAFDDTAGKPDRQTTSEREAAPETPAPEIVELDQVARPIERVSREDEGSPPKEQPAAEVGASDQAVRSQTRDRDKNLPTSRQPETNELRLEEKRAPRDATLSVSD